MRLNPGATDRRALGALRVPLISLGILVGVTVIIRLILDPLATHETRKALDQLQGFKGDFERVHVTIFGPSYAITHLKLVQTTPGGDKGGAQASARDPLVYVEHARLGISWRELLHLRLTASLRLDEPKIVITPTKTVSKGSPKAPDLSDQLQTITALKVSRIEVVGGEVLFHESAGAHQQELWVHRLDLVVQNLATRPGLSNGRPATVTGHGTVGRSGELNVFVSADPFASPLSFAGQISVQHLKAAELYEFIDPKTGLQAGKGTIDVFADFVSRRGMLTGGVKPVLKNIEIRPAEAGAWDRLKAWLADKTVKIASDRVPGRNAAATIIPIEGRLTDPDIELWPTLLGVVRNAFVEGLTSGFANVPPPMAEKKEGGLKQARNALKKDKGPPKAQPPGSKARS
jgi:uncharacterized protein DUF748